MKRLWFFFPVILIAATVAYGQATLDLASTYRTSASGGYINGDIWEFYGGALADPGPEDDGYVAVTNNDENIDKPGASLNSTLFIRHNVTNSVNPYRVDGEGVIHLTDNSVFTFSTGREGGTQIEGSNGLFYVSGGSTLLFSNGVTFLLGTTRIYMEPGARLNIIDFLRITDVYLNFNLDAKLEIHLYDSNDPADPDDDATQLIMSFDEGYFDFPWYNLTMEMQKEIPDPENEGDAVVPVYTLAMNQRIDNLEDPLVGAGDVTLHEGELTVGVRLTGQIVNRSLLNLTLGNATSFVVNGVVENEVDASMVPVIEGGVLTFGDVFNNAGDFLPGISSNGSFNVGLVATNEENASMIFNLNAGTATIGDNLVNNGILYFGLTNSSRLTVSNVLDNQRFMDFRLEENSALDLSEWRNNGSNREFAYLGDVGVQDEENVVVGPAVIDNSQLIVRGNFTFHDFGWIRIDGGGSLEVNGYFPMGDSRAENEEPGNPASWPVERKIIVLNGTIATKGVVQLNAYSYIRIGDPEYDAENDPIAPSLRSKGFFSGVDISINSWAQLWVDDWAQFLDDFITVAGYQDDQRLYVFDTHYSDVSVPTVDFPLDGPYDPWPFDFIIELLSGQCEDVWQGPPNSCTPDISLPVDLLSFTAELRGDAVWLFWKTASEENNEHFDIERSTDGMNYTSIGTVPGHGTSNDPHEYAFTDNTPPAGIVFYRLIQTDFDGTSAVYGPVSVQVDFAGQLLLYPNPVQNGACTVRVSGLKKNTEATITINGLTGKTVFAEEIATGAGGQAVRQINTGALGRGAYILHIADGDRIFKAKLIVSR